MNETRVGGKAKKVLVAGSTGYLGRRVTAELKRKGYWVRALARNREKAERIELSHDELFEADATSSASLKGVCSGIDVVISALGMRSIDAKPALEEVDFGANMNILEEAISTGVQHFIFVSVFKGDELRSQSPIMEARERVGDALKVSGLRYTIARPNGFFNDMAEFLKMARSGTFFLIGTGETQLNPIHGDDLAFELVASIENEERWNTGFDIGGPCDYTLKEIAELAGSVLGKRLNFISVPPQLIRGAAVLTRSFNANAAALMQAVSLMGSQADLRAPHYGTRRLEDFFKELASRS